LLKDDELDNQLEGVTVLSDEDRLNEVTFAVILAIIIIIIIIIEISLTNSQPGTDGVYWSTELL